MTANKSNTYHFDQQDGQSLVEFVIIIPIFFFFLSAMIFIFFNQIRTFSDDQSFVSLQISQSGFSSEERTVAHWQDKIISHKNVLNAALNPSLFFSSSKNKQDGVFQDKKHIHQNPTFAPESFTIEESKAEKIEFSTFAPLSAYENASFNFMTQTNPKQIEHEFSGTSVFAPTNDFQWSQRKNELIFDARALSMQNILFAKEYASIHYPKDNSQFNGKCFMSPLYPQCHLHPLQSKMARSAQDGANRQLLQCFSEMELGCAALIEPPAIAACTAKGLIEIANAVEFGMESKSCTKINQIILMQYTAAMGLTIEKTLENKAMEAIQRQRLQNP